MMKEAQFRQMKKTALFINTGRGSTVDEAALIKALQEGWIAAPALDVLETEPAGHDNPLLEMDNVILTAHVASASARFDTARKRRVGPSWRWCCRARGRAPASTRRCWRNPSSSAGSRSRWSAARTARLVRGKQRIAVIGAGIIGLAVVHRLLGEGHDITVFDRDPDGDKCSWGNAGAIAVTEVMPASAPGLAWRVPGWLVDLLGPLAIRPAHLPALLPWLARFVAASRPSEVARIAGTLASLLGRVYDDWVPLLATLGLSHTLHRVGALAVYESRAALLRDALEWETKRRHGIACVAMSGDEARALEPALSPTIAAAILMPAWSHVDDPKQIWAALLAAVHSGGAMFRHEEVTELPEGFDQIVIAAGAWSGRLARTIGDTIWIESERGYNITIPAPGVMLSRELIFAERKFVATPLSIGLRIGGAAEFAGLAAPANYARSRALAELARRYLPGLRTEGGTEWMGQRPATPDSLPIIARSPRRSDVIYACGHGHLGLTLAATTARIVAEMAAGPVEASPAHRRS